MRVSLFLRSIRIWSANCNGLAAGIIMLIGIIGAPNKGKSTIFSALTMNEVQIADYAFTTVKPNLGVAYARKRCVETELNTKCMPRNGLCKNGMRMLPVNMIDVAGLVPGAHLGKGMGNQFLNDLAGADLLMQVVDLSGETGIDGTAAESADPSEDVLMVRKELTEWLAGIIERHMRQLSKNADAVLGIHGIISGFKATPGQIKQAIDSASLTSGSINWNKEECLRFAEKLLALCKPMMIAANKMDKADEKKLAELRGKLKGYEIVACSGAIELAIRKAEKAGLLAYDMETRAMERRGSPNAEQARAISSIENYVKAHGGTGISGLLQTAVFSVLKKITVYPVEDEGRFTDHFGNVLPDAVLMDNGSTTLQLAERIHTDIAKGMKYGIDARSKLRIPKDYILKDDDVIKIVSIR